MTRDVVQSIATSVRDLHELSPADFPTAIERMGALTSGVVGAPDVLISFGVRSGPIEASVDGWRPMGAYRFGPHADHDAVILDQWYRAARNVAADPSVAALARTAGRTRAFLRADLADEATWRRSQVDALFAESGIRDRLVAAAPLASGTELLLLAYRRDGEPAFGPVERRRMALLASRLREVGRSVARAHGLIDGRAPLARRELEVLRLLLLGLSESAAARRLGLTVRSLHQYVVGVYQKLGVRSRGELAAHFLSAAKRDAALAHQAGRFVERERQVLDGLVRGLSEKEIADVARLSTRAVHHLVAAIYRKIGVHTRGALLARILSDTVDVE